MTDLRKRFGGLVAAHRRGKGLTQEALAERAGLSVNMISKIELGASGARFPAIQRLADALAVDPAEFFSTEISSGLQRRSAFTALSVKLIGMSDEDLAKIAELVEVMFRK